MTDEQGCSEDRAWFDVQTATMAAGMILFFIFGANASGKSTVLQELGRDDTGTRLIEADALALASTKAERQRLLDRHLTDLARLETRDDVLYAGQSPLGELLACTAAGRFEGIAPLLIDCADPVRIDRLRSRRGKKPVPEMEVLSWAAWMRLHAVDPSFYQGVLMDDGAPELHWQRWNGWRRGDPRWDVTVLNNTNEESAETAQRIVAWIDATRRSVVDGTLPLLGDRWIGR